MGKNRHKTERRFKEGKFRQQGLQTSKIEKKASCQRIQANSVPAESKGKKGIEQREETLNKGKKSLDTLSVAEPTENVGYFAERLLKHINTNAPRAEQFHLETCSFIKQFFSLEFRRGVFVGADISSESSRLLIDIGKQISENSITTLSDVYQQTKPLPVVILWSSLKILAKTCPIQPEAQQYLHFASALENDGTTTVQIIDVLSSLLEKNNRVHRALVNYTFSQLCRNFSIVEMRHLAMIIESTGNTTMTTDDKDDDDDDFKPITPKEFHKINRNLYTSSESENEIHTDLKASSKATNFEEADQSLVKTVRDALGKAAFDAGQNSDFDTDDDNPLSDSELLKIDENLSHAFIKNSKTRKQALEILRSRLVDLITIFFSKAPLDKCIMLIPLLIQMAKKFGMRSNVDKFFASISGTFTPLHERKEKGVEVSTVTLNLQEILKIVSGNFFANKGFRNLIAQATAYLIKITANHQNKSVPDEILQFFTTLHISYMNELGESTGVIDMINVAVQKYPAYFSELLTLNLNCGFGRKQYKTAPKQKKIEALSMVVPFLRKDMTTDNANHRVFKKAAKIIASQIPLLPKFKRTETLQSGKIKSDQSSGLFVAKFIRILFLFNATVNDQYKEIIAKSMELNNLLNVTVLETLLKPHVNHIRREMTSDGRKGFSLTSEIQKFIRSLENSL